MKIKNLNDSLDDLLSKIKLPSDAKIRKETNAEKAKLSINRNRTKESCSNGGKLGGPKGGKTAKDNKLGFHSMSNFERVKLSKKIGKVIGPRSYEEGFGIFGLTDKQKEANAIKGGKNSVKSEKHVNNLQLKCPHCKKIGGYTAMSRWHMDNCRYKKSNK
jgi:Zn finger protein HypA/HybF involved in hydrogenase expression